MGWTAHWPAVAGTKYDSDLFLDNVDQACNERGAIRRNADLIDRTGHFHTIGDHLQSASDVARVQNFCDHSSVYDDAFASGALFRFLDNTIDFEGDDAPSDHTTWTWDIEEWRDAAMLHPDGWTAEYPRYITDVNADEYPIGERDDEPTIDEGHKAVHRHEGRIYERQAGEWVLLGNVGMFKADKITTHRHCTTGDYLTSTVMNEIKRGYDLLTEMPWGAGWNTGINYSDHGSPTSRTSTTPLPEVFYNITYQAEFIGNMTNETAAIGGLIGGVNWAGKKANAENMYTTVAPSFISLEWQETPSSPRGVAYGSIYVSISTGSPTFFGIETAAELIGWSAKYQIEKPLNFPLAWSTTFLVRAVAGLPRLFATDTRTPNLTWDANGADVVENVWHNFSTTGPANATQTSVKLGLDVPAKKPAWCNETATLNGESRGWSTLEDYTGIVAILDFAVPGGFEMI